MMFLNPCLFRFLIWHENSRREDAEARVIANEGPFDRNQHMHIDKTGGYDGLSSLLFSCNRISSHDRLIVTESVTGKTGETLASWTRNIFKV